MKNTVEILKNLLLIFVFVSIGFAIGRHSAAKQSAPDISSKASLVRVYYLHASIRCITCNTIEKMTRELLKNKYSQAMNAGKIKFIEVNFQKDETLAKRFDVAASCVVVARVEAGQITSYQRLDKVWTLFGKPAEFNAYISDAIQTYLSPQGSLK